MRKKYFICPGAQKSGTTTLYDLLNLHPDICLSNKKETKYFLRNQVEISKQKYINSNFTSRDNKKIYGDIDPEYLYYRDVPQKIYNTLGHEVLFLFMLRNPVDRAYSHYRMSYRRGFDLGTFEEAIKNEYLRLKDNSDFALWHLSYLDRGFYFKQIKRYLSYYDVSQMKFILFEEFIKFQKSALNEIFDFLDLNKNGYPFKIDNKSSNNGGMPKLLFLSKIHGQPLKIKKVIKFFFPFREWRWKVYPYIEKYNISKKKPPDMKLETREKLIDLYRADILNLEKLIKIDLGRWLKNSKPIRAEIK